MRNQFICEIPQSVRDHLSREAIEQLDFMLEDIEPMDDVSDDDVDALWGMRQLMN